MEHTSIANSTPEAVRYSTGWLTSYFLETDTADSDTDSGELGCSNLGSSDCLPPKLKY